MCCSLQINEFVKLLRPTVQDELQKIKESDDGMCTGQDIVTHVAHNILNSLLHLPPSTQELTVVPKKHLIEIQVWFIG